MQVLSLHLRLVDWEEGQRGEGGDEVREAAGVDLPEDAVEVVHVAAEGVVVVVEAAAGAEVAVEDVGARLKNKKKK